MMQPVGGMGRIGEAFGRELGGTITYRRGSSRTAPHRQWRAHRLARRRTGRERAIEAPLVVVTIPLPVLRTIPADFSPDIRAAIEAVDYVPAVKVAFQAERRFWELDDAIYGGISWTTRDITQVWYPSAGIHQRKGILVGAYIWSDDARREVRRDVARRAPRGRTGRRRTAAPGLSPASDQGRVRRMEEHPVQRIGLGGMEP